MARTTATAMPTSRSWPGGDARALLATLFLSRGTPMLTAGDEFGRTPAGNNNAYAQDNAIDLARLGQGRPAADRLHRRAGRSCAARWRRSSPTASSPEPDGRYPMRSGSAPMAGRWTGRTASAQVLGLLLAAGPKRLALLFNRGGARAARTAAARRPALDAGCSAPPRATDCRPHSVSRLRRGAHCRDAGSMTQTSQALAVGGRDRARVVGGRRHAPPREPRHAARAARRHGAGLRVDDELAQSHRAAGAAEALVIRGRRGGAAAAAGRARGGS